MRVIDLPDIDLEQVGVALAGHDDAQHCWLIDPQSGEVVLWTSSGGIDGETCVDVDELDLIEIDPRPASEWYQDMVDFTDGISDRAAGDRLMWSLRGRGAFRRFKSELYERQPQLVPRWHVFHDVRAQRRAVTRLADAGLVDDEAARQFRADHPDPALP